MAGLAGQGQFIEPMVEPKPDKKLHRMSHGSAMGVETMWPFRKKDNIEKKTLSAANGSSSNVCDICSGNLSSEKGYLLTATQVVTSEAYWEFLLL